MKRLFTLFLVLSMILLSAGGVSAEEDVILPFPVETEVNTSYGVYSVGLRDSSDILGSGAIQLSLYAQDIYSLSDIDKLHSGSSIQIAGNVYNVSEVTVQPDGSVVIDGGSFPVVFKPYGEVYTAAINDSAVCSYVGDYTLTLPLPDKFTFYMMYAGGKTEYYDGDGFVDLLSGGTLPTFSRSSTVLSFSGGQPSAMVFTDTVVENPEETIHKAAASRGSTGGGSTGSYSGSGAGSFTLQPVLWDGAILGKCAVPAGYTMSTDVHCGDETTCLGAPIRFGVQAASNSAILGYFTSEIYLERVSGYFKHKEGQLDGQLNIFMKKYMEAPAFCDWVASRLVSNCSFWKEEDSSFPNGKVANALAEYRNRVEPGLKRLRIKTNWFDVTAAHRVYTYEYGGVTYALCVLAEVRAYQMKASSAVITAWDSPEYFYLVCPVSEYDRIHSTDFQVFIANTTYTDTFSKLQDDLTNEIQKHIEQGWARAIAASNAYVRAMNALMTQSVNSYLSSSSYSASDRFSDYIFDRNEYTTSDGYSCSISSSYDYVWEGSGGTVYYSNNALDMPYGATQLSPR